MKRISIIFILLCAALAMPMQAQEKYSMVLQQTRQLSPYEAIYQLMDYQQLVPDLPGVYFELGNRHYDLLPTRDPLHHYQELSQLLYRTKLFYGNCLHFAQDKKLPGWQYEVIAKGEKRIEYAQLEQYIRPRIEEVQRLQTACDSIHFTFVRMTELYNRCQMQFNAFLSNYARLKTAHLQLQPMERQQLLSLQQAADSIDIYIEQYLQALALQPVPGYSPHFRKEEIVLYRLDGLTYTDFLQNDIALWDYSTWVRQFLQEQTVYEKLYEDVAQEFRRLQTQLTNYRAGRALPGQMDQSLISRCNRLELATEQVDSIRRMQQSLRNAIAERMIAESAAPTSIRELTPLLLIAAERKEAAPDSAIDLIRQHLRRMAQPIQAQQMPTYTHPISGEVIQYTPYPEETVFSLLPHNMGYRCVLTDKTGSTMVVDLSYDRSLRTPILSLPGEQPLVFTKIPGNQWVLITNQTIHYLP